MDNPYAAPKAPLLNSVGNVARVSTLALFCVAISVGVTLLLSWFVAPILNGYFAEILVGSESEAYWPARLKFDLFHSSLFIIFGCWLAVKLTKIKPLLACGLVAIFVFTVYFVEVGGISGMMRSEYPMWYEIGSVYKDIALPIMFGLAWSRKQI